MKFKIGKEYQLPQGKMVLNRANSDYVHFIDKGELRYFVREWAELNVKEVEAEPYSDLEVGDLCWVHIVSTRSKQLRIYLGNGKFAGGSNLSTTFSWSEYEKLGVNIKDELNKIAGEL